MPKWITLQPGSLLKTSLFLILPGIFLFFALPFNRTHFSNDPEYAYLMNGINIGMLKPVGHTDNPGTTVQIFSAVVLRCAYLVQPDKKDGFQKYLLRNADKYIELERKGLIALNGIVMLLLGIISWILLRNVWLSLLLQIMPFTSANLTEHIFTKVSPEPVLLVATAALVLLVIWYYVLEKRNEERFAILFALALGFGVATKATFLPLMLIPILLLENRMLRKKFLRYFILFFILFTLPAVPQYPHMAKWFILLMAHTGTYGEGGLGVINVAQYLNDIVKICFNNPVLTITLLASASIIVTTLFKSSFRTEFKTNLIFRIITALAAAQIAGVIMVAKHYHANHYLVPELCLMAVSWIFIFMYLNEKLPFNFRKAFAIVPFLLLLIAAGLVSKNRNYLQAADQGYILSNQDYDKMTKLRNDEYNGYTCAYYYPTSINPYSALRWGNVYSRFQHTKAIKEIYPDGYFFDIRTNQFSLWETPVATSIMAQVSNNKLLIIGGPFEESDRYKIERSGIKLTEVFKGHTQIVFRVAFTNVASD
jgi:4-amino-4-deoxy-L-arabinose transferase-like glycosyltransferase